MDIIHKSVYIPDNRRVCVTLPESVSIGDAEIVLIIQQEKHLSPDHPNANHSSSSSALKEQALSKLAELMDDKMFNNEKQPEAEAEADAIEMAAPAPEPENKL